MGFHKLSNKNLTHDIQS